VEFLQLLAPTSLPPGKYPATELFSSQPNLQLSTELDRRLFTASLAELNPTANPQLTQQSQSQSYLTTGGLSSIISPWRQVPLYSQEEIFSTDPLRAQSLCNII
jgi:hypothetical protein